MKIAGIQTGKRKGIAKELTPVGKTLATIKDAAAQYGVETDDGKCLCFASDVQLTQDVQVSPAGKALRGKYSNNTYRATGTCMLNFRDVKTNRILRPKKARFTIVFKDNLDDIGLPDTKLDNYSFKLV